MKSKHNILIRSFLLFFLSINVFGATHNNFLAPKNKYQTLLEEIIDSYKKIINNMPHTLNEIRPNEKNLKFFYKLTNDGFEYKTLEDQSYKMLSLVIQPPSNFNKFINQFKKITSKYYPKIFQQMAFLKQSSNHIGIASLLLPKNTAEEAEKTISEELNNLIKQHSLQFKIIFKFIILTKNGDIIIVGIPDHECILKLREAIKNNKKLNKVVAKDGFLIPFFIHSTICRVLPNVNNEYLINDNDIMTINELINKQNPLSLEIEVNHFTLWNYDRGLDDPQIITKYQIKKSC